MNTRILNPIQIEKATVQIKSGNKSGTAFFVLIDNDKHLLLTADHNLVKEQPIILRFADGTEAKAEILERIMDKDVAVLQSIIKSREDIVSLPLKNLHIPYNENWETYGFPVLRVNSGGRYCGTVSRINEGTKWDVDLTCEQYANLEDFSGLSGSALIIDGYAAGIIGYENAGTLGATSIRSIAAILSKHELNVEYSKEHSIPHAIEQDISNTSPNENVIEKINEVIANQIASNFFLLSGSPGSGKTTIAAQLDLKNKQYVIIDRFFVKVPESEEYPTQIRTTPQYFTRWLEEVCFRELFNIPPPKQKDETQLNERILTIHHLLKELSDYYQKQGKIAFLLIDGLDDVSRLNIEQYLSVLPYHLPSNFKVIFSCISREVLPLAIRSAIDNSNEIKITPLARQNVERYLTSQLKDKQINSSQINELVQKSEGHPLYLRYLIKFVLESDDLLSLDNWIDSIPVIGGEIRNYYNAIWQQFDNQTENIWVAATLARLRIPVRKDILKELLPTATQHHFITSLREMQHLLRAGDYISIYHTSFSDFINDKTIDLSNQIHENIAGYILKHPKNSFGISERIYHLAQGDREAKKEAIEECNQDWVDDCAMNSVDPDIVLSDIKDVIGHAADMGIANKVISLLLLSQRVNFRYNTLFHENAIFLVNTLLSLNKPEEAIRYVVRNKTLITADEDALYLLQKFYEYDAYEEAEILLDAITQTCNNIIEAGFDTESFNRFIKLKFSAVTLSSNSDFEQAFDEWGHLKDVAVKTIERSGNPKEVIHKFKDEIGSYNSGYYIWRFNLPPHTKETEDKFNFDEKSSGFIAISIYNALNFQEKSPKRKTEDNIPAWIIDLEYVIDKYGMHEDYYFMILYILLGRSKRVDIIEKLYQLVYSEAEKFDFRAENGVDLNHQTVHQLTLFAECQGFLDVSNHFPELPTNRFYQNWENNIKNIFHYLCFITGKVKRYDTEGKDVEIKSLEPKIKEFLATLIPDLRDRIHWNRGYALPELVYPSIYKHLINLFTDFFPDQVIAFADDISKKKHYQLGLYTEGYIDSLFVIARQLAKIPKFEAPGFKVAKALEEHILTTVENRWERNEYLLRLIELYALLKNDDKAEYIFKEMIDASMGPSWYKEAQLGIINSAISSIIPQTGDQSYLQKFAAHLHNASGEMTFQRYVKQQQEEFVGDLAKIGNLDKSITFFKYLLFPDYKTIAANAESGKMDVPHTGDGYVLGARAIEEQSGILNMIQNIDCRGSLIAWALSELFILGDDRYLNGYARVQADILNYTELNDPDLSNVLYKRLSRLVITEVSDEYRDEYINDLLSKLTTSNLESVKANLESAGISFPQFVSDSIEAIEKTPLQSEKNDEPLDNLSKVKDEALIKFDSENKAGGRKIIIEALEDIQDQKYGIWSFNYSHKINEIRNLLSNSYNNSSELIKDIKNLIINEPYFEEWVIADQIIKLLKNIDEEDEKQKILSSVLEHIDLMVRTNKTFYEKYDWLNKSSDKIKIEQQDELLLGLLIWFLNHPSMVVKNRTLEILTWLGTVIPAAIVNPLINEIFNEGYQISKELSASVIHQISCINPIGFSDILKTALEKTCDQIINLKHFMITNAILDSLKELESQGHTNLNDLIDKFTESFTATSKNNRDVVIEEDYLEPISDYLDELNELNILTKDFATTLLLKIENLLPIRSITESQNTSTYIDRSFNDYNQIALVSDFDTILRYALNYAISSCVNIENRTSVADILRFYQPTFPENKLSARFYPEKDQFELNIKDIYTSSEIDIQKLLINNEYPLNFYSTKFNESQTSASEKVELTSYLIPLDQQGDDGYSYPYPTFAANNYPLLYKENKAVIPLFITSEYAGNVSGSEIIPAEINPYINKIIPDLKDSALSIYWRKGRNWDNRMQGAAEQTGYFTTLSREKVDLLKSKYKLIWQIYVGYNCKHIDVFEQKEI